MTQAIQPKAYPNDKELLNAVENGDKAVFKILSDKITGYLRDYIDNIITKVDIDDLEYD